MYRIQQFAQLAHVTVRTLHHYDRLGLLTPTLRSASGYRLYRTGDLAQLERILVLRYLGLSLREIAELLATEGSATGQNLAETLSRQITVLQVRREGIDRVLAAVERAQKQAQHSAEPDWPLYQSILKEIQMQESENWTKKYYSPEAQTSIEQRAVAWTPELQAKITADWQQMYRDVQSALDRNVEPTSAEGKALAVRWMELVGAFTGGKREVLQGLNKLYADRANWPKERMKPEETANMPKPEHIAFIRATQS